MKTRLTQILWQFAVFFYKRQALCGRNRFIVTQGVMCSHVICHVTSHVPIYWYSEWQKVTILSCNLFNIQEKTDNINSATFLKFTWQQLSMTPFDQEIWHFHGNRILTHVFQNFNFFPGLFLPSQFKIFSALRKCCILVFDQFSHIYLHPRLRTKMSTIHSNVHAILIQLVTS